VGSIDSGRQGCLRGGAGHRRHGEDELSLDFEDQFRACWWGAVAAVARLTGSLEVAEDSVQDACVAAVEQWGQSGVPENPKGWLIGVARHKAIDRLRRESLRGLKEATAVEQVHNPSDQSPVVRSVSDEDLWLIYLCCHPALNPAARIALTLRSVCGLTTSEIASAFLVPEPTMAKRLVRAKRKIRDSGMTFTLPPENLLEDRTADTLRVIYLIFSEGHMASSGSNLIRPDLCKTAINLARELRERLPSDAEVAGLLALLLLTDARRPARTGADGTLVLLEEQDRALWDRSLIDEGESLLVSVLRLGKPGPYQLWAAIAACHSTAFDAADTDWRQISILYSELLRYEPTPVVEANRAIAVAMAEGPAAGLTILDIVVNDPQLADWSPIHVARADLLARMGRIDESVAAYRTALELEPPEVESRHIYERLQSLLNEA
jgi:RNA polymerase sigma-70 factor (ECF subfamily)